MTRNDLLISYAAAVSCHVEKAAGQVLCHFDPDTTGPEMRAAAAELGYGNCEWSTPFNV